MYISKKFPKITTGDFLFGCNIAIFTIGAFVFTLESALYSFVMFYIASQMISKVELHGSEIVRLSINSDQPDHIIDFLVNNGYQATFQKVFGAYSKQERVLIITNVPVSEVDGIISSIQTFDPHTYFSQSFVKEIRGIPRSGSPKDENDDSQIA